MHHSTERGTSFMSGREGSKFATLLNSWLKVFINCETLWFLWFSSNFYWQLTVAESMPLFAYVCCYYGDLTVHVLWSVRESKHDKHAVFVFSDHGQLRFYSPYITHQAQVVQKLGNAIHRINHCYPVERYYENRLHYPWHYFIQWIALFTFKTAGAREL